MVADNSAGGGRPLLTSRAAFPFHGDGQLALFGRCVDGVGHFERRGDTWAENVDGWANGGDAGQIDRRHLSIMRFEDWSPLIHRKW